MNTQLLHAWNAFEKDTHNSFKSYGNEDLGVMSRHSTSYLNGGYLFKYPDVIKNVISRIALDASLVDISHIKIDPVTDKQESVKSSLIDIITYSANIDQTGRAFMHDLFWCLLDEGVIAAVPIETMVNPKLTSSFDILSMRVGKIVEWYPRYVKVRCFNDETGLEQDLIMPKDKVAIIESPLSSVLREHNMSLALLRQKINLMMSQDKNAATGKINGFIQLPYGTSSARRHEQAKKRRQELEDEMNNNQYGIATLDYKETFIPTGGGIQNNILDDIRKLEQDFYNQTGITESIIKGNPTAEELKLYFYRCIDPIVQAVLDSFNRTFITKTARTQGHMLKMYRDPFGLLSVESIANTADLLSRNAIITSNETRSFIGMAPHPSPLADLLFNKNIADKNQNGGISTPGQLDPGGTDGEVEPITIYEDGEGGYVDADGNPVDKNGNPL